MIELNDLDGFEWDESNRDKNWIAHQVSVGKCEEVFFNLPLLLQSDPAHSQAEDRNYVLGQTNAGRRLFIVFTVRNNQVRVISARDMSKKERVIYAQETP
jgi:uncharacterized DUF497 family protein